MYANLPLEEIQKNAYKRRSVTIAAGQTVTEYLNLYRSFQIISITGSDDVYIQTDYGDKHLAEPNTGYTLPDTVSATRVTFENQGASSCEVVFLYSAAEIRFNKMSIEGAVNVTKGDTVTTPASITAGSTATSLVSANSQRRELWIQNHDTSENLWIGDADVGNDAAPRGIKIPPEGNAIIEMAGQVYGRRGGSSDVTVTVMEVGN